jgi:hypothetical protein
MEEEMADFEVVKRVEAVVFTRAAWEAMNAAVLAEEELTDDQDALALVGHDWAGVRGFYVILDGQTVTVKEGDLINHSTGVVTSVTDRGEVSDYTATRTYAAIDSHPEPASAADSEAVEFSVTISDAPADGTTYQWEVSEDAGETWADISAETETTLAFTAATANDGFLYRCKATIYSDSAELTITV